MDRRNYMKDQIIDIFSDTNLQMLIKKTTEIHQLSIEEDISLKSLLLTTFLLTREEQALYHHYETIVNGILKDRNHNHFEEILNQIIEDIFKEKPNDVTLANKLLQNLILDGYCFHSFNASFLETICEKGLVIEEKPWDNEEIEHIRSLFQSHQVKGVFGLYQGRKETPIFFANNLESSRFYAYSSPTWFRHFVSGGMSGKEELYDKKAFFYRNYEQAFKNVQTLCHQAMLNPEEQELVFKFFHKYWNLIATKELPCVALIKRSQLKKEELLPPLEQESIESYTKRMIFYFGRGNQTIKNDIPPQDLLIFPYQLEKIKEVQPRKEHHL